MKSSFTRPVWLLGALAGLVSGCGGLEDGLPGDDPQGAKGDMVARLCSCSCVDAVGNSVLASSRLDTQSTLFELAVASEAACQGGASCAGFTPGPYGMLPNSGTMTKCSYSGSSGAPSKVAPRNAKEIFVNNNCTACHAQEKRIVGPSFDAVTAKYTDPARRPKGADGQPLTDQETRLTLAEHVRHGGAGPWGAVPMPPNPRVSDEELSTMMLYLLPDSINNR